MSAPALSVGLCRPIVALGNIGRLDTERVVGLASPRNIGIVAAIAVAAGLVPGVPGIVGGAPAEEAAAALPPPPAIVDVVTSEPIGPDDGLIRLIVTPSVAVDEPDADPAGAEDPDATEAQPDAGADAAAGSAAAGSEGEPTDADGSDEAGDEELRVAGSDADQIIDPDVLSQLTDGAVLHLDRRNRPWAVFADGTRVPLFPAGDGENLLAEREREADTEPVQDADATGDTATGDAATGETETTGPDIAAAYSVGHPLMDEIAMLAGVLSVVSLGDGSYAVTLHDPAVLDGFDVEVAEDVPMGIGSEPYERYQWALDNTGDNLNGIGANAVPAQLADADIDGVQARSEATGRGVVVAVIDSGVDFSHPDLTPARWANDDENCTNGIDDDANGFVDDCHGWDFAYEDNSPYNSGAHAHGTHVAGIIAAAIDGQGVAGVAPDAEIMDLNVGAITASGQPGITMSAVARAIRYATDNGADVINLSLGTSPGSPRAGSAAVESAILHAEANGVLVVAAAGNDGVSLDAGPGWPAGYEMSNMITVGASTPSDTRAGFSNWGRVVDIFAPGELILSTVPVASGRWKFMSGTSQATPIVAASAALLLDDVPGLPPAEVRARLIAAADRHDSLMAHVADGVRLNAAAAVGVGSPEHRLADVAVRISGLSAIGTEAPVEAEIDIAVPADFGAEDDFSWHASVFAALPDGVAVLTGHEITVDGIARASDETGSVDLGIDGSGTATVATTLPRGSYALMLEAVPVDDPTQRLGAPEVVTFTVGAAENAPGGQSTPTGSGPGPGDGSAGGGSGSGGTGGSGSGGTGGSGSGGAAPGGGVTGPGSTTSGGSGSPTQDSGSSGGSSSGSVATGTGGGSGAGSSVGGGGAGSSTTTREIIVGGGGSTSGGSTGGGTATNGGSTQGSGTSTPGSGGGSTVSAPPAPPAPVTAGTWSIDAVSPHFGAVGTVTTVQLVGRFPSAAYVWFGDVPGTVLVSSDRMMVVLAPAIPTAGSVDLSLRAPGAGTVLLVPGGFTYLGGSNTSTGTTGGGSSSGGSGGSSSSGSGAGGSGSSGSGSAPSTGSDAGGGSDPSAGPGGGSGAGGGSGTGGGSVGDGGGGPAGGGSGSGGGEATGPGAGGGGAAESDSGSSTTRRDARQSRNRGGGEVVDLGNGLRGVMVEGANPLAGAPACTSDPCRI